MPLLGFFFCDDYSVQNNPPPCQEHALTLACLVIADLREQVTQRMIIQPGALLYRVFLLSCQVRHIEGCGMSLAGNKNRTRNEKLIEPGLRIMLGTRQQGLQSGSFFCIIILRRIMPLCPSLPAVASKKKQGRKVIRFPTLFLPSRAKCERFSLLVAARAELDTGI